MVKECWTNTGAVHIVDRIFQENLDHFLGKPNDFVERCREHFAGFLESFPVHSSAIPKEQVVRIRCMVQDELGSEFFPIGCKVNSDGIERHQTGFLRDSFDVLDNTKLEPCGTTIARSRYMMVPVPGASDWWEQEWQRAGELANSPGSTIDQFIAKFVTEDELKPNTILELFGVFVEPTKNVDDMEEIRTRAEVPWFHVISHRVPKVEEIQIEAQGIEKLKEALLSAIGDPTTVNYLLFNLISTTYSRPAGSLPICSFPLNFCGIENSTKIVEIIKQLLPRVLHMKLTPELISGEHFASVKNYETDSLKQGLLQAAPGTTVIFDETSLPTGSFPVSDLASANCSTMESLLLNQQIKYDFGYYSLPFDVDMPIIVLSKETSRFIQTPWRVVVPTGTKSISGSSEELKGYRNTIQSLRNGLNGVSIDLNDVKAIQEAFVELARTLDPSKEDKSQTFHQMLILCRLVASSQGKGSVDLGSWTEARRLEKERLEIFEEWSKKLAAEQKTAA